MPAGCGERQVDQGGCLIDKAIQRCFLVTEGFLEVAILGGFDHASLHVIFEDQPGCSIKGCTDNGDLHKHIRAGSVLFDHALDGMLITLAFWMTGMLPDGQFALSEGLTVLSSLMVIVVDVVIAAVAWLRTGSGRDA